MIELLTLGLALVVVLALKQSADRPARSGPADLVHSLPGVPLSLEQSEERSHRLEGGPSIVETITSRIWRDSSGRLRIESSTTDTSGLPPTIQTAIIDPGVGSKIVLLDSERIAYRMFGPKRGENAFAAGLGGLGPALPPSHHWLTTTENIGQRKLFGAEFEGTRTVQSAEDEPQLTNTIEKWYSDELKVVGAAAVSGPDEKHTATILNLRRGDPDATLFEIPSGYKILDLPLSK